MMTMDSPLAADWKNKRVLVVDDQGEIHQDFREMLEVEDPLESNELVDLFVPSESKMSFPSFELLHASSGEDGCALIERQRDSHLPVAVAFVDVRMPPGIDGVETTRRIRNIDPDVEIVIMTAYADRPLADIVREHRLLHKLLYIRKPFAREEIQQITTALVAKWNCEQDITGARQRLTESHRRLEAVLDGTGDAIAMYDGQGRLVFSNRHYEQLFDVPAGELERMPRDAAAARFVERSHHPHVPMVNGTGTVVEQKLVDGTGRTGSATKPIFYRTTQAVYEDSGKLVGDVVVYRDLSQEVRIEQMALEMERLHVELEGAYSFSGLVGSSAGIRRVCSLIRQVVDHDVYVLVTGESGTGKELVAKALHFNGPRRKQPFVAINCAAVPETLIESELFGHEPGAFTGATTRRVGCFEQATGGTLFLDEIGDMPLGLQAKLLRVLQEREFRRVGGTTNIEVDVRVVAASNRNLEAAVREGTFREDLYYRLAVFPIEVPPLRDRPQDIALLAQHFLNKHASRLGKSVRGLSAGASLLLERHTWPGNVRELENVICRALVLETANVLQPANLPPELLPAHGEATPPGPPREAGVVPLAAVERQAISDALVREGNVARAARALEIDRTTLYRKLKKYGLAAGN